MNININSAVKTTNNNYIARAQCGMSYHYHLNTTLAKQANAAYT